MKRDKTGNHKDTSRTRRLQLHLWLSHREYDWLSAEARKHDDSLAGVVRRWINLNRSRQTPLAQSSHTSSVPAKLHRN
jgi:hypothetical protein